MSKIRALTSAEIALSRKIYKSSIDYSAVKVHDKKYNPMHPRNSAITPNGEIYTNGVYAEDYATTLPYLKSLFVHEMAHVYQYQLKILNPVYAAINEAFKHGFNYNKAYHYTLSAENDLLDYAIEQQAQIIEDYYRVNFLSLMPVKGYMQNDPAEVRRLGLFERVLKKFIENPSYAKHDLVCQRKRMNKRNKLVCTRELVR